MARTLVVSMLKEGNVDYAQKVMTSTFITNIFKQDNGDVFREEIVSSLLIAINNEKPKTAAKAAISAWQKVALNILFSCADCLTWPSQSGVAAEKYLDALFTLCSYEDSEQPAKPVEGTTPTPTTPTPKEEEEEDDDERMMLLQRVLKHLVVEQKVGEQLQLFIVLLVLLQTQFHVSQLKSFQKRNLEKAKKLRKRINLNLQKHLNFLYRINISL